VVSSDHRVQRAARHRGAKSVDSAPWYSELLSARRASGAAPWDMPTKPAGKLSPDEVAYWMDQFDEAPADPPEEAAPQRGGENMPLDDMNYPFPPGYGDDLLDEFPETSEDEPR